MKIPVFFSFERKFRNQKFQNISRTNLKKFFSQEQFQYTKNFKNNSRFSRNSRTAGHPAEWISSNSWLTKMCKKMKYDWAFQKCVWVKVFWLSFCELFQDCFSRFFRSSTPLISFGTRGYTNYNLFVLILIQFHFTF